MIQWTESRSRICSGSCHHHVPPKRIDRNAHPLLHVGGLRLCLKHALRGRRELEGSGDNDHGDQACNQQLNEAEALLTRHRGFLTFNVTSRASPGNRVTAP